MKKSIYQINGLKCDNPKCDYYNPNFKGVDYEKYVDSKCPKCGAVLLTRADQDMTMLICKILDNPIIRFINWFGVKVLRKPLTKFSLEMNGTGDFELKKVDELPDENRINLSE